MDPEKFVEEAFNKDSRIRYVGIIDNQFHIISSKMRKGVQSITTEEQERNLVQLMPPIIVDAVEKLQHRTSIPTHTNDDGSNSELCAPSQN